MTLSLNALPLAHGNNVRQARELLAQALRNGVAFSNGNKSMHGRTGGAFTTGQLPREFDAAASSATYVVYSYATPIAWRNADDSWTVPATHYSPTTSRHQSLISAAL